MKLLVVCTGNTCRSPLAAAVLQAEAAKQGVALDVVSAGTGAWEGDPASEGSYLVAIEHGHDLSAHRARLLTPELVAEADVIITMSERHLARARELGGEGKAWLYTQYAGARGDVPDPFGQGIEVYRATYERLAALAPAIVRAAAGS